jgi:hypothetical protein
MRLNGYWLAYFWVWEAGGVIKAGLEVVNGVGFVRGMAGNWGGLGVSLGENGFIGVGVWWIKKSLEKK